jgi:(E)-4-hydroxy-3-methylbut-2-enyl-diphosphate synthase
MTTLRGDTIVADFRKILDDYVRSHYGTAEQQEQLVEVH